MFDFQYIFSMIVSAFTSSFNWLRALFSSLNAWDYWIGAIILGFLVNAIILPAIFPGSSDSAKKKQKFNKKDP